MTSAETVNVSSRRFCISAFIIVEHIGKHLRTRGAGNVVKGSGNDMMAVWRVTVESEESGRSESSLFLTAHCLYRPNRAILWNTTHTVDGGRLAFDDDVPYLGFIYNHLDAMPVNFSKVSAIKLDAYSFRCTHWDEFVITGLESTFDGTKDQKIPTCLFYDKNERALRNLRDVFIQRTKAVQKSRTGGVIAIW